MGKTFSSIIYQNCIKLFDGVGEGIMIEKTGIDAGLVLGLLHVQGVDLSIDQGHVLVHAQRGESWNVS